MKKLILVVLLTFVLTGCQTAGNYLATGAAVRDKVSRTKATAALSTLCATNYNIARELFGGNWRRFEETCSPKGTLNSGN